MLRTKSWLICMLLFAVLLVACGDDDDNGADDAATSPLAVVATTAPADSDDADGTASEATDEPTEEAEATATSEATEEAGETATEETSATATEDIGSGTVTPDADATESDPGSTPDADETPESQAADPEVEAMLFETVLVEEDLPAGWTEVNTSASNEVQEDPGFCNAEPFSGVSERLASVEAEFEQDSLEGPFLIQNLAAYPEELAVGAMEYAREITTNCTEWTDDEDGTVYTLELQEDYPQFGDESFVSQITFEVPGFGPVASDIVFVRVDGLLMFMGYLGFGETDTAAVMEIAELAVEKMENAEQ